MFPLVFVAKNNKCCSGIVPILLPPEMANHATALRFAWISATPKTVSMMAGVRGQIGPLAATENRLVLGSV